MKAKSKVLLGLLVALAMMVFAVPAFAATFTVTPSIDSSVYVGTKPELSVEITSTDSSATNAPYTVTFVDSNETNGITFQQKELTTESGTVKSAPANALADTLKNTKHTITVTVENASGVKVSEDTVEFEVKEAFTAALNGATAPTAPDTEYTKAVTKGNVSGLSVMPSVQEGTHYKWQYASANTGAKDVADTAKNWTDIPDSDSPSLGTVDNLDGKYVRCLVTNGNLTVVAQNTTATATDALCCVKLTVNDASAITLDESKMVDATYLANTATPTDLQVSATGASNEYTYKWFKDGEEITSDMATEIGVDYTTTPGTLDFGAKITEKQAGKYKVEVADKTTPTIKATSKEATITVNKTPTLTVENVIESDLKSAYNDNQAAVNKTGTIVVASEDKDDALTLTAKIENPVANNVCVWKKGGANVGTGTTFNIPAKGVANGDSYVIEMTSPGLADPLTFTVNIVISEGKLEGSVFKQVDGKVKESAPYKITLPEGTEWSDTVKNLNVGDDISSIFKAKNIPANLTPKLKKAIGEDGVLEFTLEGTATAVPTVENMSLTIAKTALDPNTSDIVLPVKDGVGYDITEAAKPADVEITAPKKTAAGTADYTGSPIEATVEAKVDGLGTIGNIRYEKYTAGGEKPIAPSSAATTEAPTDAGTYAVFCDIEASEKYGEAKDVVVPEDLVINQVTLDATNADKFLEMDPDSEVYDGKEKGTTVTFKDGITKAGVVDKVTYKAIKADGTEEASEVIPVNVGKYNVYVTTKAGTTDDDKTFDNIKQVSPTAIKVGVFEITKVMPTADLYTMKPTEVTYTGAEQEPAIVKADDKAGDVAKVIYYAEGSEEALEGKPVEAGVYTVTIETKESDTYAAATGEDALELGTFTIKEEKSDEQPTIYINPHVENIGWAKESSELKAGESIDAGTTGQGLRVEAVAFIVPEDYKVVGFAHVQNEGDVEVKKVESSSDYDIPEGYVAYEFGSTGKGQRVEAVCIGLQDADGEYIKGFQYATHLQNYGWQGYVRNGSFSGTRGMGLRMESIRFTYADPDVVKPGEPSGSLLR